MIFLLREKEKVHQDWKTVPHNLKNSRNQAWEHTPVISSLRRLR
jgi:hypothetical protein